MTTSRKTPTQHKTFARKMKEGCSIRESMIAAGYSEKQANKGQKAISKKMMGAMAKEGIKMADFAKQFTTKDLGDIVVGRLVTNAMVGRDGGVMSAKTLGSHKDLNLWTQESQAGVIVINMPHISEEHLKQLLTPPADLQGDEVKK